MCKRVLQAAPFHKNTCDHAPEAALLAVSSFTEAEDTGRVEVQRYDACFSFVSVHHEPLFTETLSCIRKENSESFPHPHEVILHVHSIQKNTTWGKQIQKI